MIYRKLGEKIMVNNAVNYVKSFVADLNERLGLNVECEIVEKEKDKFPVCCRKGKLTVVPAFFNHADLSDEIKTTMLAELYSCFYLDKKMDRYLEINPGFMAKGICEELGVCYVGDSEIEKTLRLIRRKLYDDIANGCYFEIGMKLRESAFVHYEVVDITRVDSEETLVTVKPVGPLLGKPERQFTEEELFERCCNYRFIENERVDMRRNLYIISGPSGVGKDTVVKELRKYPHINKTVSATTRAKRSTEVDGVDYYFISKDEFYDHQANGDFVEYELYDGEYYGTLFSEIDRHQVDEPLILVVDVRGRRNVMMRYPMAKSIFINPPSFEVLEHRILGRNENSPEEIKHRMKVAKEEMDDASSYTYQVINNDVDSCVEAIYKIITEDFKR